MAEEYGTYTLADIAAQVKGVDAVRIERGSTSILGADEFTRGWKVSSHLVERVRYFLDTYPDGDHIATAAHHVTDPAADHGVAQPGVWRVVRNFETKDQKGWVFQTLRKGYLRPPTVSALTWAAIDTEARIWRVTEVAPDIKVAFGTHYVVVYPNVALANVREFCEQVIARGTITAPTFDGQTQLTGSYTFRAARNVEQEDGTSTVFAILVSTLVPVGFEHLIYDGCDHKEWLKFFWNLATLPAVPVSTSGIQYKLESVSLDRETGMWSCVLSRVEQKTQTLAKHTVAEDLFAKKERAVWTGVRTDDKDHLGVAIPLETVGYGTEGVLVDISRKKNANCTQDVAQDSDTEKQVLDAATSESKTVFEHVEEDTDKSVPSTTDVVVPPASGGVVTHKTVSKTRGNRRDVKTRKETEQPVTEANKSAAKTLFDHTAETVDRSQPLLTSLDVPAATGGVVTSKSGEKTAGGLLNVRTKVATEQPVSAAAKSETRTLYAVETSQVDKSQPLATSLTAPPASGGEVTTKSGQKTPGNLMDVTTRTNAEQAVTAASVSTTKTLFDTKTRQVDRSIAAPDEAVPAPVGGLVVSKSVERTPGDRKTLTTDRDQENPVADAVRVVRKRAYSTRTVTEDKSQAITPDDPTTPGTSLTVRKTAGAMVDVGEDVGSYTPFLHTYTVPGLSGAVSVREFGFYTTAQYLSLLASLGSSADWSVSPSYSEEIDRWSGRITQLRKTIRTLGVPSEAYREGLTYTEVKIEHHYGKTYAVKYVYVYNERMSNDITVAKDQYAAETARLNGSGFKADDRTNTAYYRAVVSIKMKTADKTSDYQNGVEISFESL